MPATAFLTRETLEAAFRELGLKARAADKIGITTAEQAIEIVSQYYPPSGIPPKRILALKRSLPVCRGAIDSHDLDTI